MITEYALIIYVEATARSSISSNFSSMFSPVSCSNKAKECAVFKIYKPSSKLTKPDFHVLFCGSEKSVTMSKDKKNIFPTEVVALNKYGGKITTPSPAVDPDCGCICVRIEKNNKCF